MNSGPDPQLESMWREAGFHQKAEKGSCHLELVWIPPAQQIALFPPCLNIKDPITEASHPVNKVFLM
jgi:hypothetical protein